MKEDIVTLNLTRFEIGVLLLELEALSKKEESLPIKRGFETLIHNIRVDLKKHENKNKK